MFLRPIYDPFVKTWGYSCLAIGYGCLLMSFATLPVGQGLVGRAMRSPPARLLAWLGVYSYSIYLWHIDYQNLVSYLATRWAVPWGNSITLSLLRDFWVLVYMIGSVALGIVAGRLVEQPVLAWRDRVYPSRTRSTPAPVAQPPTSRPVVVPVAAD